MSNKKETPEQPITDISIYVAALSTTYRPASAPAEATHFFSTIEVVDAIRGIDPSARSVPSRCSPHSAMPDTSSVTAPVRTA